MNIDWFTFGAQIVNFLALVYLLHRFLYGPITRTMDERQQFVTERLQQADAKAMEAEAAAERYAQLESSLERERQTRLDAVKHEVDDVRKQLLARAKQDVDHRRSDWLASLDRERHTLTQLVRHRYSHHVTAAARQALRAVADSDLEQAATAAFLRQLQATPDHNNHEATAGDADVTVVTAFALADCERELLANELAERFPGHEIAYQEDPEMVCGVELHVGARKIGWSVDEFLITLEDELKRLVEAPLA